MAQKRHVMHGRDHAANGSDPIPGMGGGGARVLNAVWAGDTPEVTATGTVWMVPEVDGSAVTFDLTRIAFRLETPGSTTTTARVEKSSGGGAFSASTVGTVSLTSGTYEGEDTSSLGSIDSGDLVRIYWEAAGTGAADYLVQLEGVQA